MTKQEIIHKMVVEMPFDLPEALRPYIEEAMDLYASQEVASAKAPLRSALYDVVDELDLSASALEEHGALGTSPAKLVRLVLGEKDQQIRMLKAGIIKV